MRRKFGTGRLQQKIGQSFACHTRHVRKPELGKQDLTWHIMIWVDWKLMGLPSRVPLSSLLTGAKSKNVAQVRMFICMYYVLYICVCLSVCVYV